MSTTITRFSCRKPSRSSPTSVTIEPEGAAGSMAMPREVVASTTVSSAAPLPRRK